MKMDFEKQLNAILTLVSKIAIAINKRNKGELNCKAYCPGEEILISSLKDFLLILREIEPECANSIEDNLIILKGANCLNPYAFGGVLGVLNMLKAKYISNNNRKRVFISHSSKDKAIINSFVKEILKIGCGFKDEDIFCTLDPSAIRTGDDFREKIIENMKKCDYILLFISENYNLSDVCKNEMGAAWALDGKRILPFTLPGISFEQMGFLNVVKQGASITEKRKLDELYQELCSNYDMVPDWPAFNTAKDDFLDSVKALI